MVVPPVRLCALHPSRTDLMRRFAPPLRLGDRTREDDTDVDELDMRAVIEVEGYNPRDGVRRAVLMIRRRNLHGPLDVRRKRFEAIENMNAIAPALGCVREMIFSVIVPQAE